MDYRATGNPRVPWGKEILDGFPGPVAIPAEPIRGLTPSLGWEQVNDEPWAINIDYAIPEGQHLLTVRTVRSPEGLNPRHPIESLASAVVNFVNMDQGARPLGTPIPVDLTEAEQRVRDHVSASRLTRADVEGTPTFPTVIAIDVVAIEGSRVDLVRCSAVELAWGEQVVFCTGLPDIIDALRLKSATPDDFV
jgi:hypothetical protein